MLKPLKSATLILVVCVLVVSLVIPTKAAITAYNPKNWIDDITYDGDMQTVHYRIGGNDSALVARQHDANWVRLSETIYYGTEFNIYPVAESRYQRLYLYLLGKDATIGTPAPDYGSIYVGDFKVGASVTVQLNYKFTMKLINLMGGGASFKYRICLNTYKQDGSYSGYVSLDEVQTGTGGEDYNETFDKQYIYERDENHYYIMPFVQIDVGHAANTDGSMYLRTLPWDFRFSVTTNMIYENSQTMQDINNKIDEIGGKIDDTNEKLDGIQDGIDDSNEKLDGIQDGIDDTNDKLDQSNDKLDNIIAQPEQEKQEASDAGDSNVGEILDVIPDESQGFMNAIKHLVGSMSYTGVDAKLTIPEIVMPTIPGVWDSFVMLESQTIDFGYWVCRFPSSIMEVVRVLLTIALIGYCFKELYSTISYAMTLKGGNS